MFCPKCATQNVEGASFCRVCGANISLVPHALSGQLPQENVEDLSRAELRRRRRHGRELGLDSAFRNAFMGLGFVFVAMALSFSPIGRGWWFWMLIPAFSMMGTGIAQYIRFKERQAKSLQAGTPPQVNQPGIQPPPRVTAFPRRNTGELVPPPPSVTEGTTRHLGAESPTRHLENDLPK